MLGDFLNSDRWLSLVFEGRNKEYGAYVNREESSDRHLKAMFIITIVALGLIFLPRLIQSVVPVADSGVGQNGVVAPILIAQKEVNTVQVNKVVPPPVQLKKTIIFTPPVVKPDDKVRDEDLIKTQLELTETKAAISIATVDDGTENGVDIAAMKGHSILVEETAKSEIPSHVEVMPLFPGGDAAMMKWLKDNLIYPVDALERNIQGRAVLRFVVNKDGSIGNVEVLKGFDPSCDKEAVRVVKKMPNWIPGRQNGNPVAVYYSLPVVFRLQNN